MADNQYLPGGRPVAMPQGLGKREDLGSSAVDREIRAALSRDYGERAGMAAAENARVGRANFARGEILAARGRRAALASAGRELEARKDRGR